MSHLDSAAILDQFLSVTILFFVDHCPLVFLKGDIVVSFVLRKYTTEGPDLHLRTFPVNDLFCGVLSHLCSRSVAGRVMAPKDVYALISMPKQGRRDFSDAIKNLGMGRVAWNIQVSPM